ncbi:fasciclin domain-containing protein [Streptomyces sp. NP-1717]|uniref:fasciclin domain-containing protein n=1 Tax=unclassified Streptomyces TaxID=2593676 RepID=UPI001F5D673D|nr:fasciclin domain-containing protein [Streptomyces sp. NP-1717]MCI3220982.1 fasciclin domain-containing protein [Streptomyces sp. NP-1717]WTA72514.1 fasciclin domain-containing protein [Streptomyces sp. NBC_00838]
MKITRFQRAAVTVVAAVALPLALTSCSSDDKDSKAESSSAAEDTAAPEETADDAAGDAADGPFGPACASVPKTGPGSFEGMGQAPVATAASNNPELSTLVTAVKKAGLVDTLNTAENITVFAPTNDAFAKIPKADLDAVLADKEMLTKILTYHVVGEKLAKKQLESGTYDTLQKSTLTTAGSGDSYKVNDSASVVCGDVPTANATVHIIDTVLMPK